MTEAAIRAALSGKQILGLTIWAEARGDHAEGASSVEERIAVGCIIRNRAKPGAWWGETIREVCLKPWQFSCWNPGPDQNHAALVLVAEELAQANIGIRTRPGLDPLLEESLFLAEGIVDGLILDRTQGCDHYYAPRAMRPAGAVPKWAKWPDGSTVPPTVIVGSQHFYRLGLDGKP